VLHKQATLPGLPALIYYTADDVGLFGTRCVHLLSITLCVPRPVLLSDCPHLGTDGYLATTCQYRR
jgi:hypothetical protein